MELILHQQLNSSNGWLSSGRSGLEHNGISVELCRNPNVYRTTVSLQLLKAESTWGMDSRFPSGFRRCRRRTTVLTLLNVVDDTVTSILWGSLPFCTCKHEICVKICECIIKCKMLIWTWLFLCCRHLPFQCSLPFFKKKNVFHTFKTHLAI